MSHALVDAQFVNERTLQGEINILAVFFNRYNGSKLLNNTRKHICLILN